MARKKKKKKPLVRVELGLGGLLGVSTVCFCIFLWMFLFGVWTGQTLLSENAPIDVGIGLADKAASLMRDESRPSSVSNKESIVPSAIKKTVSQSKSTANRDNSFFAIQVAAFRDQQLAIKAVAKWRARDYESFYFAPDTPDSTFNLVFVGRFDSMDKANILASKLEALEHNKVFITLVDGDRPQLP